jgi:hypothetical protein
MESHVLEQVAKLPNANALSLIYGEYGPLNGNGIKHLYAGLISHQGKTLDDGVIYLPFWLLGYEAMLSIFVDRSDQNAPYQSMVMSRTIVDAKREYLTTGGHQDVLDNFTIDSPIPFDLDGVLTELGRLNTEMVPGAKTEKQGDFHGR